MVPERRSQESTSRGNPWLFRHFIFTFIVCWLSGIGVGLVIQTWAT